MQVGGGRREVKGSYSHQKDSRATAGMGAENKERRTTRIHNIRPLFGIRSEVGNGREKCYREKKEGSGLYAVIAVTAMLEN